MNALAAIALGGLHDSDTERPAGPRRPRGLDRGLGIRAGERRTRDVQHDIDAERHGTEMTGTLDRGGQPARVIARRQTD